MRVLQHVKAYNTKDGGVERVTHELVRGLNANAGIVCDVLCQGSASGRMMCGNHEVLTAATTFTLSSAGLSWADFFEWRARRQHYDAIHIHSPWPQGNVNALLAPVRGAVVVHWHSDIVRDRLLYAAFKPFETWLLGRADAICVTSEKLMLESAVLPRFRNKCHVIPIGISDLQASVTPAARAQVAECAQGRKIVFALGRLVLYKGFYYLVEAAKRLPEDYLVVIGGRGTLMPDLRAQIEAAGLSRRVKLAGYLSDDEAQAYMEACACFCLPSVHNAEAFGVVQLEAMRSAKPIISTRVKGSGVDWVNQHSVTGLVVQPQDPEALAQAIRELGDNASLRERLGNNGRARYETLFKADRMVAATEALYRKLL